MAKVVQNIKLNINNSKCTVPVTEGNEKYFMYNNYLYQNVASLLSTILLLRQPLWGSTLYVVTTTTYSKVVATKTLPLSQRYTGTGRGMTYSKYRPISNSLLYKKILQPLAILRIKPFSMLGLLSNNIDYLAIF